MYGNSWSREQCMGTVGVGSSVWEQLELGAVLWKQMEQEAINGNSGNKVQCMGIVGTWSSVLYIF